MSQDVISLGSNFSIQYTPSPSIQSVCSFDKVLPTWYHNLPINVLVNIFQYFTEKELIKNIIPVCQHWRYAATRPELWKVLKFYGTEVPTSFICDRIRRFRQVHTIFLDHIAEPVFVIRQICRCLPDLKSIAIRHCIPIPEAVLRYLIHSCTKLEKLDLSGTDFKGYRFYQEVSSLLNLKSVNFSDNRFITARNLLSVALNCPNLEEIKLSRYISEKDQLTDEDVSFMVSNIAHKLKSITLDATNLTDVTFQSLLNCKKLNKLAFYGASNLSGHMFAQLWEFCPEIKHLKIRQGHQITGMHVQQLFSRGKDVFQFLKSLDLTGCWKISDIGIDAIADSCPILDKLSLKSCKNIHSVRSICDKCQRMRHFNISFCQNLDSETVFPLPKSIETLVIDETGKFKKLIKKLKAHNKRLKLIAALSEYNKTTRKLKIKSDGDKPEKKVHKKKKLKQTTETL